MQYQDQQNKYYYWLANIPGIGSKTIFRLSQQLGSPETIYRTPIRDLAPLLSEKQFYNVKQSKKNWNVEIQYDQLQKKQIELIPFYHPDYPRRLSNIPDQPAALYLIGKLPEEDHPAVAIIGARSCSEYGRFMARQFGITLAKAGVQIVSGLARGIDSISQKAAVEAGGTAFAILGCGVDICYPRENQTIYDQIKQSGGLISEYPPGTEPQAGHFPPRNRIISGLAEYLLVVEAKVKSGTLITVDMALDQGREVFALPGRLTDPLSAGCNKLIKQGAGLVLTPEDFLWETGIIKDEKSNKPINKSIHPPLTSIEKSLYQVLDIIPQSPDQILNQCPSISIEQVLPALVSLCIKDMAFQTAAGCYIKTLKQQ